MKQNQRVVILAGFHEFIGKEGRVTTPNEYKDGANWLHRVTLDEPIDVPGIGLITDDLWVSSFLRKIK